MVNTFAQAWLIASVELGIEVVHPFTFKTKSGREATTQGVYLPQFGAPDGALLLCRFDADELDELANDTAFFLSALNPNSYEPYRREIYVETLNDWGWFGPSEQEPDWYEPTPWGHPTATEQKHD